MSGKPLVWLALVLAIVVVSGSGCIKRASGDTTFIYNSKSEQPRGGYSGPFYRPNRFERPATTVEGQCGDCRVSKKTCAPCAKLFLEGEHYCDHCREAEIFCDPCRRAGE